MKTKLLLLLAFLPFFLRAQEGVKNFIDQPYIEVTGTAEMEIVPDEIYLKIIISESDNKAKQSLEELEKQMFGELEKIGVNVSKDLSILDFTSNFKNYFLRDNKILTRKTYQLVVHDGKTAGKVFQNLETMGISNISVEKVDHSKLEEFKKEVKIKAIKAAKEKAGFLAEALGQSVGSAIFVQEMNIGVMDNQMVNVLQGRVAGIAVKGFKSNQMEESEPEVEFEKISQFATILVRFELRSKLGF
jgi:uncharacterized protein YggE